jgi:hypothetical protein
MHLDEIDGELHILDENHDIIHVWTRSSQNSGPGAERARSSDANGEVTLSRAAYKHMCGWVKTHWTPDSDPDDLWVRAEQAWDALTPEAQMYLWSMSHQEEQNAQDLCTALLAHLSEYRGLENVKKAFYGAIRSVLDQFT